MDILKNLTNLLGSAIAPSEYQNGQQPQNQQSSYAGQANPRQPGSAGGLESVLTPAVLGSLANALFPSSKTNTSTSATSGAGLGGLGGILTGLMTSGALSGLFKENTSSDTPSIPDHTQRPSPIPAQSAQSSQDRTARMLRALVFAAKSDGHIDQDEQNALNTQMQQLNLGPQAKTLLKQFMTEPLDPNLVANGVTSQQEAVQLYGLSCALTDRDNFMERSYLDGLATALALPDQAKNTIETQVRSDR